MPSLTSEERALADQLAGRVRHLAGEIGGRHSGGSMGLQFPSQYIQRRIRDLVGNFRSRALVHRAIGTFRRYAAFLSESTAAPVWIAGIGWSDHWTFWQHEYPAIMIADTALFSYRPYHTAEDTPASSPTIAWRASSPGCSTLSGISQECWSLGALAELRDLASCSLRVQSPASVGVMADSHRLKKAKRSVRMILRTMEVASGK